MPLRRMEGSVKRLKVSILLMMSSGSSLHTIPALLVHILEVLGSHSIQTAELKHIIGALRPLSNGQLVVMLMYQAPVSFISLSLSLCSLPTTTVFRKL